MLVYFQSIFLNFPGILPSIFSKFTFQKFMLFNQTNQFKKQEFQTVKKKEQTDSMVITLLYTPAKGCTAGDPKLELEVLTLNINEGHNKELMEQCQTLKEYAQIFKNIHNHSAQVEALAAETVRT